MKTTGISRFALCLFAALSTGAIAQDVRTQEGENLAATCAACHGTAGHSIGVMPVLAGIDKAAMFAAMQAFKNGQRPGTIMPQLAKGNSDLQIATLAEFFSKQQPEP